MKLIATTADTMDSLGQFITAEQHTTVWADIQSVSRAEFAAAGQIGTKPSLVAKVKAWEYAGQQIVAYAGVRYAVYRTYTKGDITELYLCVQAGVTDAN